MVGATTVVVGAVSIMVVAQPVSNTAVANTERTKGFFMAWSGVDENAIADERIDRDLIVVNAYS